MTKPDRIRDGGTETEREAKKKRNLSPSPSGEVHPPLCEPDNHARPEMRDDQDEPPVTETANLQSPISKPYIPDELTDPNVYPEIPTAFKDTQAKYDAKLGDPLVVTFQQEGNLAPSCLFHHSHLLPIRERAKKAVLHAAKSIIRLSSSVDGKPLANCCGLWIKWHHESKKGIVLTTAHLIRTKHPTENHWEGKDEYNSKANVIVHLLDDRTAQAHFLYHQQHYDLAFFEVRVDEPVHLASSSGSSVHCGQDVFRLGRDDHMNLRITHGRVEDRNPGSNERHHYMYFLHQKNDFLSHRKNDDSIIHQKNDDYLFDDDGGSIIDLDGKVVGLVNKHLQKSFLPSCIMDKCVDLWYEFGCIPRLHLGMRFTSIKLLDPVRVDKLWRKYKIEDGLIVKEVSKESHAEKFGICSGDIIERFNGERISTTVQLESMLLGRCRDHLNQGNRLNAKIDVSIQVFHTEERLRRMINLTVKVSDGGEVIIRRTCPITEGMSTSVQSSQRVADDPCLPRPALTWENLAQLYA